MVPAQHIQHRGRDLSLFRGGSAGMQALSEVLPSVANKKVGRGGFMVLRPDSGDPVEAVLEALRAAEKVFGVDINSKGYKASALLPVHNNKIRCAIPVSSCLKRRGPSLQPRRKKQCVQLLYSLLTLGS